MKYSVLLMTILLRIWNTVLVHLHVYCRYHKLALSCKKSGLWKRGGLLRRRSNLSWESYVSWSVNVFWRLMIVLGGSVVLPIGMVANCLAEAADNCLNDFRSFDVARYFTFVVFAFRWVWIRLCTFHGKGTFFFNSACSRAIPFEYLTFWAF